MQLGRVVGHAVSTVKHASLHGWKLLVVQMLTPDGKEDGEPILAIDNLGAGVENLVIVSNDGAGARMSVSNIRDQGRSPDERQRNPGPAFKLADRSRISLRSSGLQLGACP